LVACGGYPDGDSQSAARDPVASTEQAIAAPGSNFDLSHWQLQLPIGKSGSPTVISNTQLEAGFTDAYFYTGSDGAMNFWCPVNGVKTTTAAYPRSELREVGANGKAAGWNITSGTHVLSATVAALKLPSQRQRVTVGQVHESSPNDYPMVMLFYDTGSVVAHIQNSATASGGTEYTLATGIPLGQKFSYTIHPKPNLTVDITVNGKTSTFTVPSGFASEVLYFKAGDYLQVAGTSSTDGGQVAFYSLVLNGTGTDAGTD
jgi:hypothetical protein